MGIELCLMPKVIIASGRSVSIKHTPRNRNGLVDLRNESNTYDGLKNH